uniref:Uncharacterized protein n=1 Tax=Peduovirinae sp. ctOza1 TaxID=2825095 RepID=A0A8S5UW33_9CAUD|nr:MAG TPA: hypothetical protein [Peduovirinae sp. ctOza1]
MIPGGSFAPRPASNGGLLLMSCSCMKTTA